MGVMLDLYVRREHDLRIVDLFSQHGFEVTVYARTLADGSRTPFYKCIRGDERFSVILMPLSKDAEHLGIGVMARPRHSQTMLFAARALEENGALSSADYHATQTI